MVFKQAINEQIYFRERGICMKQGGRKSRKKHEF